jgi:hypothetical protein
LAKGPAGAAKQAAQVEASLARKKKRAEMTKRGQEKEMEIACRVRMGEDRVVFQEQYGSELSTDFDDGDHSKEEELESGDANSFVVKPRGTVGSGIPEGSWTCSSALEARTCITEDDLASTEEAKWARVKKHSGAL